MIMLGQLNNNETIGFMMTPKKNLVVDLHDLKPVTEHSKIYDLTDLKETD